MGEPASNWLDLSRGLVDALGAMESRTFLTVSWSSVPTVYVQLEQAADRLVARTGADDVTVDDAAAGSTREALERDGWTAPERDPSAQRTWTLVLGWPARSAAYEELAGRCVAVFRDVHGVPSPAELEYRAWRDAEPDPVGVTFYPEDLEPAEPHLVLPDLALPDAQDD